jgi:hypothetical protein
MKAGTVHEGSVETRTSDEMQANEEVSKEFAPFTLINYFMVKSI